MFALTDEDLSAYLDEILSVDRAAEVERALRDSSELREQLAEHIATRDQGGHSLGEIWRRERLSCPSRDELCAFLLGAVADDQRDYLAFHLEVIGCRFCQANRDDLLATGAFHPNAEDNTGETKARRRRLFESSAGCIAPAFPLSDHHGPHEN